MNYKKLILTGIFLCLFSSAVMGATAVYPIDQVYPGLKGIGKTVVRGIKIEEFAVEVIDVIPQPASTPPLIMVEVSGDVIDRSGGIASGMSGSPIYIDGKLLGALSHAYEYSNFRIGLVTPAEAMLALLDMFPQYEQVIPAGFAEIKTPVAVSGIKARALEALSDKLKAHNVQVIPGVSGIMQQMGEVTLEPGSAFAVQLLRGDFQVAAFGTITDIDERQRFIGFGHPFMHKGDVNYFAAPAMVHYVMPHAEIPYKIASAGESIGVVYQDRAAGVAGQLNIPQEYIPIDIHVADVDRNIEQSYHVEAVADDSLLSALAISSAYQGIDSTLDRLGQGTAYVKLEFYVKDMPVPIIRTNMFYSDSDIAVWALSDLSDGLDLITTNNLQHIELERINVSIRVENTRKTAEIEKAVPRVFQVYPGESVDVEVKIRPFRGMVETRVLRIQIPEDTLPGLMTVTVRGGSSGYYAIKPTVHTTIESLQQEELDEMWRESTTAESLDILLNKYMNRERNNEIVAEFYPFIDMSSDIEDETGFGEWYFYSEDFIPVSEIEMLEHEIASPKWEVSSNEPIRVRLITQYVIEGSASFDIEVL